MNEELREALGEINPEALLADGLEDAFIGYTVNHHHAHVAVYDIAKCIEVLVARDGAFVGENGPIYIRTAP